MNKKIIMFISILALFLLVFSSFAYASGSSMDYIKENGLSDLKYDDTITLAMIAKVLSEGGSDVSSLIERLNRNPVNQDLETDALSLLVTLKKETAASIASRQKADGSWNDDMYTTALVTYVLKAVKLEDTAAKKGAEFLLKSQNSNGSWGNLGVSDEGITAMTVLSLRTSGYNDAALKSGIDWLLLHQGVDGSWETNEATAIAITALNEVTYKDKTEKAAKYLKSIQNKDGGFGISGIESSHPYTSAFVLFALQKYDKSSKEVDKALSYIKKLASDKVWVDKALSFYDASEIWYLLKDDPDFASLKKDYEYVLESFQGAENYDYLSRKLSYLATQGEDTSSLVDEFIGSINEDGGWGYATGYSSDPMDTMLVLRALLDSGYNNADNYKLVTSYFSSIMNSDGSFSLNFSSEGHLYLTSLITEQLVRLNQYIDCSSLIATSRDWILSMRKSANVDDNAGNGESVVGTGYYGDTMLETARALSAILDGLTSSDVRNAFELLKSNMQKDFSWDNDTITTAAVLNLLGRDKIDLAASSQNITFTADQGVVSEELTINVLVENKGLLEALNVPVKLYLGDEKTGTLIGTNTIDNISGGSSNMSSFSWKPTMTGSANFTLVIDPENTLIETNEKNNSATQKIAIVTRPDITIDTTDVSFSPDVPNDTDIFTLKAKVQNKGQMDASYFYINFYKGDPKAGGERFYTVKCSGLQAGASIDISATYRLPDGKHDIHIVSDVNGDIFESNETNNIVIKELVIKSDHDLRISSSDITISPETPFDFEESQIKVTIHNNGLSQVNDFDVIFSNGEIGKGGKMLGMARCSGIPGMSSTEAVLKGNFNAGMYDLYVVVDSSDEITEPDNTNNTAHKAITINSKYDLAVDASSIITSPIAPSEIDDVTIKAAVKNLGLFDADSFKVLFTVGSPKTGTLLGIVKCSGIKAGSKAEITWTGKIPAGSQDIFVTADMDNEIQESDKLNNIAMKTVQINKKQDLAVYSYEMSINPGSPLDTNDIEIKACVHNVGQTDAGPFEVVFSSTDPVQGNAVLDVIKCKGIAAQSKEYVSWKGKLPAGKYEMFVSVDTEYEIDELDELNNICQKTLDVMPNAEIKIKPDLSGSISGGAEDSKAKVTFNIENKGGKDAEDVHISTYMGEVKPENSLGDEIVIPIISAGSAASITKSFDISKASKDLTLFAVIDPQNTIDEADETNNKMSLSVQRAVYMDLAVGNSDVLLLPEVLSEGDTLNISAKVVNNLDEAAKDVLVRLSVKSGNKWSNVNEQKVTIDGNSSANVLFQWNSINHPGANTLKIEIDPLKNLYEKDRSDNFVEKDFLVSKADLPADGGGHLNGKVYNDYIEFGVSKDGLFTVGTTDGIPSTPNDNNKPMLYGHPYGESSYTTIKVDGTDYKYIANTKKPTIKLSDLSNISEYTINNMSITQKVAIVKNPHTNRSDTVKVSYVVKNNDTVSHDTGVRVLLDTMLGTNDKAIFRIPGLGITDTEVEFFGNEVPQYWQSFESLNDPKIMAQGTLFTEKGNNPDQLVITNWRKAFDNRWLPAVTPGAKIDDSAVCIYWNQKAILPGESREYVTCYGLCDLQQESFEGLMLGLDGMGSLVEANGNYTPNPFAVTSYISNIGSVDLKNVKVKIILPEGLKLAEGSVTEKSINNIGANKEEMISWNVLAVPSAIKRTLTYSVTVSADEMELKKISKTVYLPGIPGAAGSSETGASTNTPTTSGGSNTNTSNTNTSNTNTSNTNTSNTNTSNTNTSNTTNASNTSKSANSTTVTVPDDKVPAASNDDLALFISADKAIYQKDDTIVFTIDYKNLLTKTCGDFEITCEIPKSTTILDKGDGTIKDEKITFEIKGLKALEMGQKSFKVKVGELPASEISATAKASISSSYLLINKLDDESYINVTLRSGEFGNIKHTAYIKGYPNGTFKPEKEITRAEAASIFVKLMNLSVSKDAMGEYKDVAKDYWAAQYIAAATKAGIFNGYPDGTFKPEDRISRAELAVAVAKSLKLQSVKPLNIHYKDIDRHWALSYIEELIRFKIISGYQDGSFKPDSNVKRAEAVCIFNKMIGRGPLSIEANSFPDVQQSYWAFGQVEEAARDHGFIPGKDEEIFVK